MGDDPLGGDPLGEPRSPKGPKKEIDRASPDPTILTNPSLAPKSDPADPTKDALGARVVRQTTSYAFFRTIASLSTLVSYAFLVRILERRDIGVFEIGMAYVGFGFVLGEGGLSAALVRKKGDVTQHELRVVQTTVLGLASLLALLYLALAPWIGRLNHFTESETWVLRVLAPILVLRAFPIVPRARMQREMRFDHFGLVELSATLARNVTAVIAALAFGGSWALVAAALAQATAAIVAGYSLSPGWVGLGFQMHTFRRLISFGSKVQGTYFLHYLRENVAVGLLGPALGPAPVALYRFAYTYARIPSDAIGGLARVHFRMYALCEPHSEQLASSIRTALRASTLLGALILGILASAAVWTIPLIYSEKWLPAVPIVWALMPHVLADIGMAQLVAMAQGQGKPGKALWFYVIWSVLTWLACGAALLFGKNALDWIGWGQSLGTVTAAVVALIWAQRQASAPIISALLRPLVALSCGAVGAYWVVRGMSGSSLLQALAGVGTFLALSATLAFTLDRTALLNDLRGAVASFRKKRTTTA